MSTTNHVLDTLMSQTQKTHGRDKVESPRGQQPAAEKIKSKQDHKGSKESKELQKDVNAKPTKVADIGAKKLGHPPPPAEAGGSNEAPASMATILSSVNQLQGLMGSFCTKIDTVNTDITALKEGQGFLENQIYEWEHNEQQQGAMQHDYDEESEEGEIPPPYNGGRNRPNHDMSDEEDNNNDAAANNVGQPMVNADQDPSADWLSSVRQDCGLTEVKQAPIKEEWAQVINRVATNGLQDQALKDRRAKILDIDNLKMLVAPRLNDCVWTVVGKDIRSKDSALQNLQKSIVKGLAPIIKVADNLLKPHVAVDPAQAFAEISNGVALILAGHHGINMLRRDMVKPDLNRDFKSICSQNCPISTELFGDELPKRLKEIGDSNRAGSKVGKMRSKSWNNYPPRGGFARGNYRGSMRTPYGYPYPARGRGYSNNNYGSYQNNYGYNQGFSGRSRGRGYFLDGGQQSHAPKQDNNSRRGKK